MTADWVERLRAFFDGEPAVTLAYLFGSHAVGRAGPDSDVDIGVLLADVRHEDRLWREASELCPRDVDLVVLNYASATIISAVLKTGMPLSVKDRGIYVDLLLDATSEAEDFCGFVADFARVAARSRSLSAEDRTRLLRRIAFLREELAETDAFAAVSLDVYRGSRARRREMERWAENIANATIDIAKIVLASRRAAVPQSYREALRELGIATGLAAADTDRLEGVARLRNLFAHEYLELLYERIRLLTDELPGVYARILSYVQRVADEEADDA